MHLVARSRQEAPATGAFLPTSLASPGAVPNPEPGELPPSGYPALAESNAGNLDATLPRIHLHLEMAGSELADGNTRRISAGSALHPGGIGHSRRKVAQSMLRLAQPPRMKAVRMPLGKDRTRSLGNWACRVEMIE
jgi:hypothetical protein